MLLHPVKDMEDPEVAEVLAKANGLEPEKATAVKEAAKLEVIAKEAAVRAQVKAIADTANAENKEVAR